VLATAAGVATEQVGGTRHLVGLTTDGGVYELRGSLVGEWFLPFATLLACTERPKARR
jgi:hypothetical protein